MTTDVIAQVASYLAEHTERELGAELFYYNMPTEVDECTVVQRTRSGRAVPAVIDAGVTAVRIVSRSTTSDKAYALAKEMYDVLDNREDFTDGDQPGFIELAETRALVTLYDAPQFDKQDQQGRKTFEFYALLITSH